MDGEQSRKTWTGTGRREDGIMRKKGLAAALALILCLGLAAPALAANVFAFTEKTISVFEGESIQTALRREGSYEGDGEITFSSAKESIASISGDGTLTGVTKGQTEITATLTRNGKRVAKAQASVKVLRPVQKVTLNTTRLSVYEPGDPAVAGLLKAETVYPVLVIPAGTTANLNTTCTPEDASNRRVTYTTTDAGVAKAGESSIRAIQQGECDLVVASTLNPEVTETFRVLVIQPVKKIQIDAGNRKVAAGSTLQLTAACAPENASIREVTWSSGNPNIATVDEFGIVTGLKKGTVNIMATAADGSNTKATVSLSVTQSVTSLSITQPELSVTVGRSVQAKVKAEPAEASDKSVSWSSSNTEIATVSANGTVTGKKAGTTMITATSKSNPDIFATVMVSVNQLVTKIEVTNSKEELTLRTGESVQLQWYVLPDDATNTAVSFRSQQPKIAAVDPNGVVTALARGTATIAVTSQDAAKRQQTARVTVIQPVTGVSMKEDLYYVQRGGSANVRAVVEPNNANNQKIIWSSADPGIAAIRSNGTSTGSVTGISVGDTYINAYTEDGGFIAASTIRVGNFNEAVMVENLEVDQNNEIRIVLRNMTTDLTFGTVYYQVDCYDMNGNPMICNTNETSTFFNGTYSAPLLPLERSAHGYFRFQNYVIPDLLGGVVLTITGWRDADGHAWTIPEGNRMPIQWTRIQSLFPPEGIG